MEYLQRPLWHEGMFLTPNLFQQMDRVGDWQLRTALRQLQPFRTGLVTLEIDRDALSSETVSVLAAAGVMPDGTLFNMPEADPLPAPRPFREQFTAGLDRLPVYLAMPAVRPGTPSVGEPGREPGSPMRHQRRSVSVRDDVAGGAEREITTAVKDVRLLVGNESLDGYTAVRIAQLVRGPSGGYAIADDFAPPALAIAAAPALTRLLRRVVDICCAKATHLAQGRRARTQGVVEFSASESANYTLLHTLNGAIPALMHLLRYPQCHPEKLYLELARLSGMLQTFAVEGHAKDVPAYDHEDLGTTFSAIEKHLRGLLETNVAVRYTPLPLAKGASSVWSTRLPETVLEAHRIYLSVQSSAAAEKISTQTPAKAKVACTARVPQLVAQSLKGLALTYLSVPPAEIPAQPGNSYFELQRAGDEWDQVVEARTLGIYLPPDFTDLKLEFMAVKE